MTAPTTADIERFRALLARQFGFQFHVDKDPWLGDILGERLHATGRSAAAYLATPTLEREEARTLARLLTVTETYFFRAPDQLRAFVRVMIERPEAPRAVRVLCAGCASGEEPYSIAMLVKGSAFATAHDVSILGADVNQTMLEQARVGTYSAWSLRETPAVSRDRWFVPKGKRFEVDRTIRAMVTFEERNLVDDDASFWQRGLYDAVFCRNVLMYLAAPVASDLISRFARVLRPGGLLFLGHADSLRGLSSDFDLHHADGTFYYERRSSSAVRAARATEPGSSAESVRERPNDEHESEGHPRSDWVPPDPGAGSWVDAIRQASERVDKLGRSHATASETGLEAVAAAAAANLDGDLEEARELLGRERFLEARAILDRLPPDAAHDLGVLLLRAVLLTHGGDLVEARAVCDELLGRERGVAGAGAHYLLALCHEAEGALGEAASHHRRASDLDAAFAMPRLHLGRLARRSGSHAEARAHLEEALVLLEHEDASRLLLFGGGFQRDTLVALCRGELAACGRR